MHETSQMQALIDHLRDCAASERNQARKNRKPAAVFQMEDPIAWTKIFGFDANRYYTDADFYFEMILRQKLWRWENFPFDHAALTLDIPARIGLYPEYTFVGLDVQFTADGVPLIQKDHPLTRQPDLHLLELVDFKTSGWMPRILRWYDTLNRISDGRLDIKLYEGTGVWWRGCLDLAIELRGYENFVTDVVERPQFVHDLLKWLVEQRMRWYEGYYRHFGLQPGPVFIGDDWINVPFITPAMFADFVLPRYKELEEFHGGIKSIHSCGNQVPVQKYMLEIESIEIFEISPWSDLQQSLENIPEHKRLSCSIHANDVLCAGPHEMESQLRKIVTACSDRDYSVFTSGLTPLSGDVDEFIGKIRTWTEIAEHIVR